MPPPDTTTHQREVIPRFGFTDDERTAIGNERAGGPPAVIATAVAPGRGPGRGRGRGRGRGHGCGRGCGRVIGKISRSYCIGARVKCKASEFGQKWAQDHYGNDESAWRSAWTEGTIEAVDGTKN